MSATLLVKAAITAWETSNVQELASCLSDDFLCWNLFPQFVDKQAYLLF